LLKLGRIAQRLTYVSMAYSIYGTPRNSPERVSYGTVQSLEQAAVEMKRLRKAGVSEVYAIGSDHESANQPQPSRPASTPNRAIADLDATQ
jgi:hypothetical protein